MAVSDGHQIVVYKEMGLVSQVFTEGVLASLQGHLAIGHCRYSTTGSSVWENAQPTFRATATGPPSLWPQRQSHQHPRAGRAGRRGRAGLRGAAARDTPMHSTSDTDLLTALLAAYQGESADDRGGRRAARACAAPSAWSSWTTPPSTRPAIRRASGRWSIGRLAGGGWVVASETAALDIVGAHVRARGRARRGRRDRRAGAAHASASPPAEPKGCLFEFVYLARPDTRIAGRSVHATRVEIGRDPGPGAPGRGRPGDPHPGVRHARRRRLRAGQRDPVRPGPGEERLRGADLHPALPDDPPARHPAQAQPPARRDRGQAAGRRRRLDRAREHPARHRADAARGRRRRGARADLQPAGAWPCFYGIDFATRDRADRQRPLGRGDPRSRSVPTPWATSRWRA